MRKNTKSAKNNSGRRFRFADFFILFLFLFIAAFSVNIFRLDLLQSIRLQNVEPAGIVIIKKNTVQRRLGNRVLWDRLANESPVYVGDLIRVADVSAATLDIGKNSIELDENTLVRILLSPDGEGLQIELSSGSLSLVSGPESGSITLDLNGRKVQTVPGAVLTASATEDGVSLRVSAGNVQLVEDGVVREFSSVNILSVDPQGVERKERAAVVTKPAPNARFLKTGTGAFPVNFEWNRINLSPDETLRLEIAENRSFRNISQTVSNLDKYARVLLNSGLWHWRLSFQGEVLGEGRLTVTDAGTQLISPAQNSVFHYQENLPVLNFQWSEAEEASFYILEVSDERDFNNPKIRRQGTSSFYIDSSLGRGTWYWRVISVFPPVYEGGASGSGEGRGGVYSSTAVFRIEQGVVENEELSLTEWLAAEAPPSMRPPVEEPPPAPPPVPAPAARPATPPPAPPPPAARPATPPPPPAPAARPAPTVRLTLLQPADNSSINALEALRQQTVFRWDCDTEISRSLFVVSQNLNPLRGRPAIEISNPERTVRIDRLGEGTWYWTVEVRTTSGLTVSAPPRRFQVLPAPLLAAPQLLRPDANYRFGVEQILSIKEIKFEWSSVSGANGYIFSLYRQTTDGGRLQIIDSDPQTQTDFTIDDLKVLDRGAYIWQVEAVSINRSGMIEQRGTPAERVFVFDFPSPGQVKIEDAGILYGN